MNMYFILHNGYVPVKGKDRCIILDLFHGCLFEISELLYDVLSTNFNEDFTVEQLKQYFDNEISDGIDAYFNSFVNKGIGSFVKSRLEIKEFNLEYHSPLTLDTLLMEIGEENFDGIQSAFEQVSNLLLRSLELRVKVSVNITDLVDRLKIFDKSTVRVINIIFDYNKFINDNSIRGLFLKIKRIGNIRILDAPNDLRISDSNVAIKHNCSFESEEDYFIINHDIFLEAKHYNIGLNRKIFIETNGDMKNYFSHKESFGNIFTDSVIDVLSQSEIKKKWLIGNDRIEGCMECSYRYICSSISDIKKIKGKYYKLKKCTLNAKIC